MVFARRRFMSQYILVTNSNLTLLTCLGIVRKTTRMRNECAFDPCSSGRRIFFNPGHLRYVDVLKVEYS